MAPLPEGWVARHCLITGKVQGVWYRAWTIEQAQARGLKGWVCNCADGSVEAVFAGPEAKVGDMILACRQGPPAARVTGVGVEEFAGDIPDTFAKKSSS